MPNPLKIATKGAEIGFQVGSFVAGQAFQRVKSLLDRDGDDDQARYAPTTPAAPAKLEPVPTTSTGSKPTTPASTATGPGAAKRTAPAAPKKDITAKPSTGDSKGETSTTVKAASRTGARSAGGRISNPKAARKVRARSAGASAKAGAGASAGQKPGTPTAAARTGDLSKAAGKGGRPATVTAENSPAEADKGRQAAPLGSSDA